MKVWRFRSMLMACTGMAALCVAMPAMAQNQQRLQEQSSDEAETGQQPAGAANYLSPIVVEGGGAGVDPYGTPGPVSTITPDEIEQFGEFGLRFESAYHTHIRLAGRDFQPV